MGKEKPQRNHIVVANSETIGIGRLLLLVNETIKEIYIVLWNGRIVSILLGKQPSYRARNSTVASFLSCDEPKRSIESS
jgi:hypothetical protein